MVCANTTAHPALAVLCLAVDKVHDDVYIVAHVYVIIHSCLVPAYCGQQVAHAAACAIERELNDWRAVALLRGKRRDTRAKLCAVRVDGMRALLHCALAEPGVCSRLPAYAHDGLQLLVPQRVVSVLV